MIDARLEVDGDHEIVMLVGATATTARLVGAVGAEHRRLGQHVSRAARGE